MNKNELFEHIVEFYLNSGDFNGIPMYCLPSYNPEDMVELINEGLVETISESETINPHIKGFEFELTTDQHVSNAAGKNGQVCFYPTKKALESTKVEHSFWFSDSANGDNARWWKHHDPYYSGFL